jgi:hypothetical protein
MPGLARAAGATDIAEFRGLSSAGDGYVMTLREGYAPGPQEALEDLDMGGGSILSLKVTARQSNGLVTVVEGVALAGGPPLHVHQAEDQVVICIEGRLAYQIGAKRGNLDPGGVLFPMLLRTSPASPSIE